MKAHRKIAKVARRWRWQLRSSNYRPFYWHIGTPNFGDDINPEFFQRLCKTEVRFSPQRNRPNFLGMGSILHAATQFSTVLGSGLIRPDARPESVGAVIAVRGALTRNTMGLADSTLLGDPMVLVNLLEPKVSARKARIALIPHISNLAAMRRTFGDRFDIINPGLDPFKVVRLIAGCSRVISQSLHGLIVADAMEVPNVWLAPSANMAGQDFKFMDYFSTIEGSKCRISEDQILTGDLPNANFSVNPYLFDKQSYREALTAALHKKGPGVSTGALFIPAAE